MGKHSKKNGKKTKWTTFEINYDDNNAKLQDDSQPNTEDATDGPPNMGELCSVSAASDGGVDAYRTDEWSEISQQIEEWGRSVNETQQINNEPVTLHPEWDQGVNVTQQNDNMPITENLDDEMLSVIIEHNYINYVRSDIKRHLSYLVPNWKMLDFYERLKLDPQFNGQWELSRPGEEGTPLPTIKTEICDGAEVFTGPAVLSTIGDGWCMLHATVGSYNMQVRPVELLDVAGVSQLCFEHLFREAHKYFYFFKSMQSFLDEVWSYFVKKQYSSTVGDIFMVVLSKVLNVNIEIYCSDTPENSRTLTTDVNNPNILVYKFNDHYSRVLLMNRATRESREYIRLFEDPNAQVTLGPEGGSMQMSSLEE